MHEEYHVTDCDPALMRVKFLCRRITIIYRQTYMKVHPGAWSHGLNPLIHYGRLAYSRLLCRLFLAVLLRLCIFRALLSDAVHLRLRFLDLLCRN